MESQCTGDRRLAFTRDAQILQGQEDSDIIQRLQQQLEEVLATLEKKANVQWVEEIAEMTGAAEKRPALLVAEMIDAATARVNDMKERLEEQFQEVKVDSACKIGGGAGKGSVG